MSSLRGNDAWNHRNAADNHTSAVLGQECLIHSTDRLSFILSPLSSPSRGCIRYLPIPHKIHPDYGTSTRLPQQREKKKKKIRGVPTHIPRRGRARGS